MLGALVLGGGPARAEVTTSGWVQVDAIPWSADSQDELDPSTREPLAEERFLIRRARLRADVARPDGVFGMVELDGNTVAGATARILAAQVGYRYPATGTPLVTVTAGLFRTPFGMEVPMAERDKPFLEPPTASRALFPGNYDGGIGASGAWGLARWSVAIVNGAPALDAQWHGRDPSSSYDVVGRLGAVVEGPRRLRVEVGVSAITGAGLSPGEPPTKDDLQWIDENQDGLVQTTELQVVPGTPGSPSQPFDRQALGADLQIHWCLCALGTGWGFFEGVLATNLDRGVVYADPVAASRDLRHAGIALGFVQQLGAHAQIGARYDRYDADRDASERLGLDLVGTHKVFSTLALMAAGRWGDARLTVQYDRERNPFGRADDGAPTTRSADRLSLRAQVGF